MNFFHAAAGWIAHLFDTHGFPVVTKYGQSWEPTLIIVFVAARAISATAYLIFIAVFGSFFVEWRRGRIDRIAAEKHVPRVAAIYLVSVCFDFLLQLGLVVGFWYPAFRILGLMALAAGLTLLGAALKSVWALSLSIVHDVKAGR